MITSIHRFLLLLLAARQPGVWVVRHPPPRKIVNIKMLVKNDLLLLKKY
jgi:hypothetical protein